MRLSVVIPAYNEAAKIARDLRQTGEYLAKRSYSSEVLIVDDGSRDGTGREVERFRAEFPAGKVKFRLLTYERNRGKGYAVRYGIARAKGEMVAFMDAGLCVPLRHLEDGMRKLDEGFDYAIASRRLPEALIRRAQPLYRRIGSRAFWLVVQTFMGVRVSDTQCGFKLYTARAAKQIFSRVGTDGFMFDIEALMVAEKLGLKGTEFPVEWSNDQDTRYHPVWGTLRNLKELTRIRLRLLGA